jgi:hypothetical protein
MSINVKDGMEIMVGMRGGDGVGRRRSGKGGRLPHIAVEFDEFAFDHRLHKAFLRAATILHYVSP